MIVVASTIEILILFQFLAAHLLFFEVWLSFWTVVPYKRPRGPFSKTFPATSEKIIFQTEV